MHSFIICPDRPHYEEAIKEFICRERTGSGKKPTTKDSPIILKCQSDFDSAKFKAAFANPSQTDSVFIVPELGWDYNYSVNSGYEIAVKLLTDKRKLAGLFVNIVFVSLYPQKLLTRMVDTEYVEMAKSFPHITLSDIFKSDAPIKLPVYSHIHFELLNRVVISKSGQLDFIKHKLSHLTSIDPKQETKDISKAKVNIKKVLGLLSLPSFGGNKNDNSDKIRTFEDDLETTESKDGIRDLVARLRQFIDEVKVQIGGSKDSLAHSLNPNKYPYRVLIVEDNQTYRDNLKALFLKCLGPTTYVETYSGEAITGSRPTLLDVSPSENDIPRADVRIKEAAGNFNIVILDMMYTSGGNEDDLAANINGFDLYRILREEEGKRAVRKAAVRIVTALPRNDISSLAEKLFKESSFEEPIVFTKGNGWEQLEGCLIDRMDEIIAECKKNEEDYLKGKRYYPKAGIFKKPGMYDAIKAGMEEIIDPVSEKTRFETVFDYAASVASGNNPMDTWQLPTAIVPTDIWNKGKLDVILAHRRLVIKFLLSDYAPSVQIKHSREFETYYDAQAYRDFLVDGSYLTVAAIEALKKKKDGGFRQDYLQTNLGFSLSKPQSKNPESSSYRASINLEDSLRFFKGECESLKGDAGNPVLSDFIEDAFYMLNNNESNLADIYKDAGIDKLITGKHSKESLTVVLKKVYEYLSDGKKDMSNRFELKGVIIDLIEQTEDEDPEGYDKLQQNCPKSLIEAIERITEYSFD